MPTPEQLAENTGRYDAAARGRPLLVVQAGPMSAPVLDGLGFVRRGEIRLDADHL